MTGSDEELRSQLSVELNRAGMGLGTGMRELLLAQVPALVAQLESGDPQVAGPTARRLLAACWPHRTPDSAWWATPLGRRIAQAYPEDQGIGRQEAAVLLSTSRSRVDHLVEAGVLRADGHDGVTRSSVLRRLASHAKR